jgi:hypothetical protein
VSRYPFGVTWNRAPVSFWKYQKKLFPVFSDIPDSRDQAFMDFFSGIDNSFLSF